ncbi:MAG: 7TM diverse intracellular signaling domain-containing protein [Ferruginibacter sp.]
MKLLTLHKLFLFFFIQSICIVSIAQQPNVYYNKEENISIGYNKLYYIAAGDSLNKLVDAQKNYANGKFKGSKNPRLNLGIASDNFWVTFNLINTVNESASLILDLENPRLNEVDVYAVNKTKATLITRLGDNFPFRQRILNYNQFAIPFTLKPLDTIRFYFLIKQKGNTLQLPVSIHKQNSFYKKIEKEYLLIGFTSGVLLLTAFFSFFLFFKSLNKVYLFYALYILSTLLWLISTEGYGFQFIWPGSPEAATRFGPGFSAFNLCGFIATALAFTKPYDDTKWIRKVLNGIIFVMLLWGMQAFMPYIDIRNTQLMSVFLRTSFFIYAIALSFVVYYLLYVSIKKNKIVLFYFFAIMTIMVFSLLLIAKNTGLINIPLSSGSFISIGLVFEIALMTLGIASQFYQYKKEKEEIMLEYLEQQKSVTKNLLITQEAERKRISRELHDDIGSGLTRLVLMSDSINNHAPENNPTLHKISETCRKLVNDMGEIVWSLQPENNSLSQLISYLREELNKMLEYSGINYKLLFPEIIPEVVIGNELRRNILLIIKESVHNAIKYSAAEKITIQIKLNTDSLDAIIKDDGKGFDTALSLNGNGLKNMQHRIIESGGELNIHSGTQGTHIECHFPFGN